MNEQSRALRETGAAYEAPYPCRTLVVRDPETLLGIHEPDVNACLWLRSLDDSAARELAIFASRGDPFESRLELGAHDDLPSRLAMLVAGCIPAELRWALEKDIVELVRLYQRLADPKCIVVALLLAADDACRRFHTDELGLRLLCTYVGPGTECAPDHAVDRRTRAASMLMCGVSVLPIVHIGHPSRLARGQELGKQFETSSLT